MHFGICGELTENGDFWAVKRKWSFVLIRISQPATRGKKIWCLLFNFYTYRPPNVFKTNSISEKLIEKVDLIV